MIFLEKKGYPLEMHGQRVGWANISQDESNNTYCHVVVASVGEEGARYGYNVSFTPSLEYHNLPKAHDEGFIAVSALSLELSKKANTKASYLSSLNDVDEITPLLHNGASPYPIEDNVKKWSNNGSSLLETIKAELGASGHSRYYPIIYYALNLSIGLDEQLQTAGSDHSDTQSLLLPDLSMRSQTSQEMFDADRTASILATILQIDDETRVKISGLPMTSSEEFVADYLKSRYQVSSQEQEFSYVISKMITSNCIFNDPTIASSFRLSDLRHWSHTMPTRHCGETKKLKNDFSNVYSVVEQEIKEVSDRLKAIERGAAILAMLKRAEEGTVVTRFVKQKQFALDV